MTEQLSLTGGPPVVTAEDGQRLGPSQLAVLEEIRRFGRLDNDEAGAIVHELRGKHSRDARCQWCAADGKHLLASLEKHGLSEPAAATGVATAAGSEKPRARRTDPPTSHRAADSVGDLRESQIAVLLCFLQHGPMHDELLQARYQQSPPQSVSGLRTRRRELFDRGLLRATGETAKTVCNRATAIWELTSQGHAEAQQHARDVVDPLDAIGF